MDQVKLVEHFQIYINLYIEETHYSYSYREVLQMNISIKKFSVLFNFESIQNISWSYEKC